MAATGKTRVTLYADQEHSGIRLAIFAGLFVGLLLGFRLSSLIIGAIAPESWLDYLIFLSCVGAFPFALLFIWLLEKALKRYWHSGLSLELDGRGLYVNDQRDGAPPATNPEPAMTWSGNMNQLNWYFRLGGYPRGGRERRISAKWLCLATEFQQDDARLSVYTFMPPDMAAPWIDNVKEGFVIINPAELYDSSSRARIGPPARPMMPQSLLQSREARYWLAERRRWEFGIELAPENFATLKEFVAAARGTTVTIAN